MTRRHVAGRTPGGPRGNEMSEKTVIGEEEVLTPFMRAQVEDFYAQVEADLSDWERRLIGKGVRHG